MAVSPTPPSISVLPSAPLPTDAEAVFDAKAGVRLTAEEVMVTEQNAALAWQAASMADTKDYKDAAATSATAAASSATLAGQQVGLAEDQVELAADQVVLATTQAANAASSASNAQVYAAAAQAAAGLPALTGNAGKVLTVDSGEASVSFQAPKPPGLVLLQTYNLIGVVSVDVEGAFDAKYDEYVLIASGLKSASSTALYLRMKIGGAYLTGDVYNYQVSEATSNTVGFTSAGANSRPQGFLQITAVTPTSVASLNLELSISCPTDAASIKVIGSRGVSVNNTTQLYRTQGFVGCTTAGALTGVRLFGPATAFTSGVVRLYGVYK